MKNPDLPNAKPSPLWGEGAEQSEADEGDVPTGRRLNIRIGGRYPPHPSSGFRETPDATFPPRGEGSVGSPSPIAYCLFAAYCLLPIACCLLPLNSAEPIGEDRRLNPVIGSGAFAQMAVSRLPRYSITGFRSCQSFFSENRKKRKEGSNRSAHGGNWDLSIRQ